MNKNEDLHEEIYALKLSLGAKDELVTSRRLLAMLYDSLTTSGTTIEIVTIRHLAALQWETYGDEKKRQFYTDWTDRIARINNPLSEIHKRDMLYTEMLKSTDLKIPMIKYKEMDEEKRKYEDLIKIFKKAISDEKKENNLEGNVRKQLSMRNKWLR